MGVTDDSMGNVRCREAWKSVSFAAAIACRSSIGQAYARSHGEGNLSAGAVANLALQAWTSHPPDPTSAESDAINQPTADTLRDTSELPKLRQ